MTKFNQIWDKAAECMPISERKRHQLQRLQEIVKIAYEKVPYYKSKFDEINLKPTDIKSLEDITKIPLTTKDDLRQAYPFGLLTVPIEKIVEIHASSGTTGKPVVSGYTRKDIEIWSEVMARALTMVGATTHDFIQNCYGYGLFTGGFGIHYGAHRIGATIIPISAGNTKKQISVMQDFGSNIITCTPSYALYLAEVMEEMGIKKEQLKLIAGCFGAEMWTEKIREQIESRLGIKALNIYGLTEMIGPGVAQECIHKNGLHIFDDHFYPEIISPDTLQPLKEGEKGELVLTNLTREGMPLIRFRTKDITSLHYEPCNCGRTHARMSRITGRSDDMMKIRGVMVFPSQIEAALLEMKEVEPHYQIIITRPGQLDELEVKVEASTKLLSDEIRHIEQVRKHLESHIERSIGLRVKVSLAEPKSLPRSEGKAVRVIDNRNL